MNGFKLIIQTDPEETEAASVFVDGTVDGLKYRFLLDTGAAMSYLVLDDHTATFDYIGKHNDSGVFSASTSDLVIAPKIELGPISKRDFPLARCAKRNPAFTNIFGMDFLHDHRYHFFFAEDRVDVDAEEIVIPCQPLLLGKKHHPYVDVRFGREIAKAVWDSGAGVTVVDLSLIEKHHANFEPAGWSFGSDAPGVKIETPMYIMSEAVIGGYIFPPHRVAAVDLSPVNSTTETPMSLILGYSTLRKANWWLDFHGKSWAITRMLDPGD